MVRGEALRETIRVWVKPSEENLDDAQPQRVDDEMQNAETSAPGVVMDTTPPSDADPSETVGTGATTSEE